MRIVFVGDSITDGDTYARWVRQAVVEAGKPAPICFNAGAGGNTAAQMLERLDRDVLSRKPDVVTISAGINDILQGVAPAIFQTNLRKIAKMVREWNARLVIFTTTPLRDPAGNAGLLAFNEAIRHVAGENGGVVAEINAALSRAVSDGIAVHEDDGVHITYGGYHVMIRPILDALGYVGVAAPRDLKLEPLRGIIPLWRLRAVRDEKAPPLTSQQVAAIKPDETWAAVRLPQSESQPHWWSDQCRRQGYAVALDSVGDGAKRFIGFATFRSETEREMRLNTGGDIDSVWLNGVRVFWREAWAGYHAGAERIASRLKAGENTLVIECKTSFFISVTEDDRW